MVNIDKNQNPYNPDEESEVIPLDTFFSPEEAPTEEEEEREGGGIGDYAKDKAKEKIKEKVKEKFSKEGVEKGVEKAGKKTVEKLGKEGVKQTGKVAAGAAAKGAASVGAAVGEGATVAATTGAETAGVGVAVGAAITAVQTADAVLKIPLGMIVGEYKKVELPEGVFIFLICLAIDVFHYLSVIIVIGLLLGPVVKLFFIGLLGGWFLYFKGGTKASGLIWLLIKALSIILFFPISAIFAIDVFRHNKIISETIKSASPTQKSKNKPSSTPKTSSTKGAGAKKT